MTLRKGDHGQAVADLQDALLACGEALPRWGEDGRLGDETLVAMGSLCRAHGRPWVGDTISDDDVAYVFSLRNQLASHTPLSNIIDRRPFAGLSKDGGPRGWDHVKGWCLHQTACTLHASRDVARCDQIGAHWVVYPDGRIFKLHDINRVIWHGNGWNAQTIGIEIDGLFAGVEGDPATVWDDPSTPYRETATSVTPEQIEAVKAIIRADHAEIVAHGGKPTVIVAHRQSSRDRPNDPGSKVWQEIAIPMLAELALNDGGPGFALNDGYGGKPIPTAWDPSRPGIPY